MWVVGLALTDPITGSIEVDCQGADLIENTQAFVVLTLSFASSPTRYAFLYDGAGNWTAYFWGTGF